MTVPRNHLTGKPLSHGLGVMEFWEAVDLELAKQQHVGGTYAEVHGRRLDGQTVISTATSIIRARARKGVL